jgi:lysozyme
VKTSQKGIDLIKHFEGCRLKAYKCPAGIWTIGCGHTGNVNPDDVITMERAEELLKHDLARFEKAVKRLINVPLSQNQFDALVSFTFNLGEGSLERSTLRRKLNVGNYNAVPVELNRWVYAGKQKLAGLVRRRKAEGHLFKTGELNFFLDS